MSWSEDGKYVALQTASGTHLLAFHPEAYSSDSLTGEDVEASFEVVDTLSGNTRIGVWYKQAYLCVINSKLAIHIGDHVSWDLDESNLYDSYHDHCYCCTKK